MSVGFSFLLDGPFSMMRWSQFSSRSQMTIVERAVVLAEGTIIGVHDLPLDSDVHSSTAS